MLLQTQGSSSLLNADRRAEGFWPRTAAATAAWEQPFPDNNAIGLLWLTLVLTGGAVTP